MAPLLLSLVFRLKLIGVQTHSRRSLKRFFSTFFTKEKHNVNNIMRMQFPPILFTLIIKSFNIHISVCVQIVRQKQIQGLNYVYILYTNLSYLGEYNYRLNYRNI